MSDATGTSRQSVARSMAAASMRSAVVPFIALVTLPVVLRNVPLGEYGLWVTLGGLVAILATSDSGFVTATSRRVALASGAKNSDAVIAVGRKGIATAVGMALVTIPVVGLLGIPVVHLVAPEEDFRLGIALWMIALLLRPFSAYFMILAGVLVGLQRTDLAATATTVGALIGAALTVGAVLGGLGVWGLVLGGGSAVFASTLGFMYFTRRVTGTRRIWTPLPSAGWSRLLLAALALAWLEASLMLEPAVSKAVLAAVDGTDLSAAYQVASSVTRVGLIAAIAPTGALLVGVAEWRVQQPQRIRALVRHTSMVSLGIVGVVSGVLFALGPYLADEWLGTAIPGVGPAIRGLSLVAVATQVVWLFSKTLLGHGNTKVVTICLVAGTGVSLLLMVPGARMLGIIGVILSSLVGACVTSVLLTAVDREYRSTIWRAVGRILPALLVLGIIGAWFADAYSPEGRIEVTVLAFGTATIATVLAWALLPRDSRALILRTVGEKVGKRG
jgi:O-antigen/teichoic acid export membrane protein